MSVDRRIRRLFARSNELVKAGIVGETRAREEFRRGCQLLLKSLDAQGSLTYSNHEILTPEILVLCAETAVANGDFAMAHKASERFFLGHPPEDQFFCRALFVRAQVQAYNNVDATGQDAVDKTLTAVSSLLRCVEIALSPLKFPRYNFIVYNASVHFWNITRRMMRAGSCRYLCEPMAAVVDALTKAADDMPLAWQCRYQLRLAQCYDDEGDSKNAAQCILAAHGIVGKLTATMNDDDDGTESKQAVALPQAAKRQEVEALRRQVRDLGIYMGRTKDGECVKASSAVAAAWRDAGFHSADAAALENVVQQARAGVLGDTPEKLEEALGSALESLEKKSSAPAAAVDDGDGGDGGGGGGDGAAVRRRGPALTWQELDVAARLGLEAARCDIFGVAERAIVLVEAVKLKPPTADVVLGYLKAVFIVRTFEKRYAPVHSSGVIRAVPVQLPRQKMRALALARRMEAIATLQRSLLTCNRLRLPNLMQDGCVLAWNIGLPLLTPRLRKHAHRLFVSCANFLDELNSPLVSLRARLHFEIAKFEVASDFLTKALDHVHDALGIDYGQITAEVIDTPEFDITDALVQKVKGDKCR